MDRNKTVSPRTRSVSRRRSSRSASICSIRRRVLSLGGTTEDCRAKKQRDVENPSVGACAKEVSAAAAALSLSGRSVETAGLYSLDVLSWSLRYYGLFILLRIVSLSAPGLLARVSERQEGGTVVSLAECLGKALRSSRWHCRTLSFEEFESGLAPSLKESMIRDGRADGRATVLPVLLSKAIVCPTMLC
jgi:hypothetical protein